jgi:hypothetical protein
MQMYGMFEVWSLLTVCTKLWAREKRERERIFINNRNMTLKKFAVSNAIQ